ncbi:MAG: hypothetical protein H6712_15280 [Myxococcales bacterium]|nr:hypothetical protein [Myxococcales bacterium]
MKQARVAGLLLCIGPCLACGSTADDDPVEQEMAPWPPPIPTKCEGLALPAERGSDTAIGHFTTAYWFDRESLVTWLGASPDPSQAIVVLASHTQYDCSEVLRSNDLDFAKTFGSQTVYLFPGPLELGTFELGVDDVEGWNTNQFGDGMGNAGYSEGDLPDGTMITIDAITEECITGTQQLEGYDPQGFAVQNRASCG